MKLLAIDTATAVAAVGVVSDVAGEGPWEVEVPSKNHAPTLMGAIDEALRRAGLDLDGVDGVAVGVGPGSFTGVRIGVATARALAFAAAKPIWGVSTLAAMARRANADVIESPTGKSLVVVAVPSRQGEVFVAAFDGDVSVLAPCTLATAALDSWVRANARPVIRVGLDAAFVGPRSRDIAALAFIVAAQTPVGQGDAIAPAYLAPPPASRCCHP